MKHQTWKKSLSAFLALVMIVVMIPAVGVSAEEYTEGYYTYTVENGKATITDVDNSITGDIVTPSTLGGCPVTKIGDS